MEWDDEEDKPAGRIPRCRPDLMEDLKEYGCKVLPPEDTGIKVVLTLTDFQTDKVYLKSFDEDYFFVVEKRDILSTAKDFNFIIQGYNKTVGV